MFSKKRYRSNNYSLSFVKSNHTNIFQKQLIAINFIDYLLQHASNESMDFLRIFCDKPINKPVSQDKQLYKLYQKKYHRKGLGIFFLSFIRFLGPRRFPSRNYIAFCFTKKQFKVKIPKFSFIVFQGKLHIGSKMNFYVPLIDREQLVNLDIGVDKSFTLKGV